MSVWNADYIQRLEFHTNLERIFEAGKPIDEIDDSFTCSDFEGKIIAFKASFGFYLHYIEVFYIEDF